MDNSVALCVHQQGDLECLAAWVGGAQRQEERGELLPGKHPVGREQGRRSVSSPPSWLGHASHTCALLVSDWCRRGQVTQ